MIGAAAAKADGCREEATPTNSAATLAVKDDAVE